MYISQLKIQGFKSFVKKSTLDFGEGITAVVGPNGCGKTNIVDAIRWVLGEQKSTVLRGGKLEDVIFNGAEGLKPLSMSEVSLVVHNNKGKLPVEYNDVEITRRAYRDGESEYFINRTPCRLKDIHDLFMDTGMGADAYSVIELGMIEQILAENRDDRKRMFEEAAGINKYKLERRSAMRKFDAVGEDLERINFVIDEVENKVHGLALQLKRFKRHAKLVEKLHENEVRLAYLQTTYYRGQIQPLTERASELKHLRESTLSSGNKNEEELKRIKEVYRGQRTELDEIQAKLQAIESEREEQANSILITTEQRRAASENIKRLHRENENIDRRHAELNSTITDNQQAVAEIDPEIERHLNLYQQRKTDFEQAEKEHKATQAEVDEIQSGRWQLQQEISRNQAGLDKAQDTVGEIEAGLESLAADISSRDKLQQELAGEQQQLEKRRQEIETQLTAGQRQADELQTTADDLSKDLKTAENQVQVRQNRLEIKRSQLRFYRDLVASGEGYPDGARYILEHPDLFPGIETSLGEIITADAGRERILQAALGNLLYSLVTSDRQTALQALAVVEEKQAGHVSLLPLDAVQPVSPKPPELPSDPNIIGPAIDGVKVDEKYSALVQILLGDLVMVKDLAAALDMKKLAGFSLIDEQGNQAHGGLRLANPEATSDTTAIGRRQKIGDLENTMGELEREIAAGRDTSKRLQKDLDEITGRIKTAEQQVEQRKADLEAIEKELIKNHYDQSRFLENQQEAQRQRQQSLERLRQFKAEIEKLKPLVSRGKSALEADENKLSQLASQLEDKQVHRDQLSRQVQDARIEAMNLQNQRDNLQFKIRAARESQTEFTQRQAEIGKEIDELETAIDRMAENITGSEQALKTIVSRLKQQRSVLDLKKEVTEETYQSIEALESRIRSEQRDREALLEELRECEVKAAQYQEQIKTVTARIDEKYSQSLPERLVVDESEDELKLTIERTRRSIDSIGPVNMAVQVEHAEEEERLKLLVDQRADLIESEDNLRETIQKIDRVARKQFMDTFSRIKENFEKLFKMFFEGGEGTLTLAGDPDPLEASIAIHAQPPGKRNQSLRVLSAGEKALTAIALLFSIYQVKPSPYCILDEVDAPLDDVNIGKFTNVLNRFSDETQFIVVTHNKLTMEAANYLYGITMERKGVSKLVSVKFDD